PLVAETDEWLAFDVAKTERRIRDLLAHIDTLPAKGDFDLESRARLIERLGLLGEVPALIDGVRGLRSQVLHGDYGSQNLLFRGGSLHAVVDFCPPRAFLAAYELGRAALEPELFHVSDWLERAFALVRAYCIECPVSLEDARRAPRAWLIQLLR